MRATINARFAGTCQVTQRRYPAGAEIQKTERGWALADAETAEVLAAMASAPIRLSRKEADSYGETGFEGWTRGQVVREGDALLVIVAAVREVTPDYDDESYDQVRWHGWARPATDEEAAPVTAEAERQQRLRAALARHSKAKRALRDLPSEPVDGLPAEQPVEVVRLDPDSARTGGRYALYTDALIYADGTVLLSTYNGDDDRTWGPGGWLSRKDGPDVADLVRAAAHRRFAGDTEVPLDDPDLVEALAAPAQWEV